MSGRDGKRETKAHHLLAAPRSVQGRTRARVHRRNPRHHLHPGLVRYYHHCEFLINTCLVTKPFASTSGLSKPFRPPTFVRPQVGLIVQSAPIPAAAEIPQITVATREPSIDLELPELPDEDMEETEDRGRTSHAIKRLITGSQLCSVSQVIDLPDVDIRWQPIYSTKVPVSFQAVDFWKRILLIALIFQTKDRELEFEALRRSLHKVFMLSGEEGWSKLSGRGLDAYKRYK